MRTIQGRFANFALQSNWNMIKIIFSIDNNWNKLNILYSFCSKFFSLQKKIKRSKRMKKFMDVNNIKICIDDTEYGEKAILLFHGLTGSKEGMYPIRDMLKEEYRVITIDTRGHGESTRPKDYYIDDHAHDVHEIVKQLNLGKINILGYSMGSYIALKTAELYPEDMDHLILVCTKPSGKTSSVARLLKEANLDITQVSQV